MSTTREPRNSNQTKTWGLVSILRIEKVHQSLIYLMELKKLTIILNVKEDLLSMQDKNLLKEKIKLLRIVSEENQRTI